MNDTPDPHEPTGSPAPDPNKAADPQDASRRRPPSDSSPAPGQASSADPATGRDQTADQTSQQPGQTHQTDQTADQTSQAGPAPGTPFSGDAFSAGTGPGSTTPGGAFPGGAFPDGASQAPNQGNGEGFFGSVRRTGLARTQDRWVGGVAGGVARRLGIDPTLVRCLWVAVTVFTGIGPLVYGLGWALLPEEADGRVHVEQALSGRFEAGLAGAVGTVIIGMTLLDNGMLPGWYFQLWGVPGLSWVLWSLFWMALLALAIVGGIRYLSGQRGGGASQPHSGGGTQFPAGPSFPATPPSAGAHSPMGSAPAGGAPDAGAPSPSGTGGGSTGLATGAPPSSAESSAPSAPAPAPGTWAVPGPAASRTPYPGPGNPGGAYHNHGNRAAPYPGGSGVGPYPSPAHAGYGGGSPAPRPWRPGPGRGLSLTVLGLALICAAGILIAVRAGHIGVFQAHLLLAGAVVGLLGAGVLVSGLRRRRGGWMTAMGWPVLLFVLPGLVLGMLVPTSFTRLSWPEVLHGTESSTIVTWEELVASAGGSTSVTRDLSLGRLVLDLRDMPADAAESLSTIRASVDVGNLSVLVSEDQPVRIEARADVGDINAEMTGDWQVDGTLMGGSGNKEPGGAAGLYTVDGDPVVESEYHVTGVDREATVVSAQAAGSRNQAELVTLIASTNVGSVDISAESKEVTWYGITEEDVWVVYRWYKAGGSIPQTSLPVPGMDHAAVTSDTADQCLESVQEEHDARAEEDDEEDQDGSDSSGDWEDDTTWIDLPDLGDQQRAAYDTCISQQISTGAGGRQGSAATAPTSPSTDPSTGADPSAGASNEASPAPSATATP